MAQPLDSLVLTSSGYSQISDITAGTKVLTRYGEPAEVTDIFRKKLDVYKISLNDGSCFRVSSNHKNVVYTLKENNKREYTLETLELKDLVDNHTDDKFYVEVIHFDTLESQDDDLFKLDPELLGILLSSVIGIKGSTVTVSIPLNKLRHVARLLSTMGCSLIVNPDVVELRPGVCCDIKSIELIECIKEATAGPIGNFPLRLNYKILYQPYEYRDKFLAGYMSVRSNQNNQVIFRNQLVDSTVFSTLVRSLGYIDHAKAVKTKPNDRFTIYIHNVDFQCTEGRYITSIELEGQEDCISITVDDPDHTYITDYMIPTHNADNLAAKYRPTTFEDMVEQKVIVDIVKNICNSPEISNRNFLFIGPAGTGKAELLTNKILTTSGFKMMKDIKIGDEVFTGKGNRGRVIGIYPQGKRPIYRITLQDRTYIDVSDEHLNVFYRYNQDKKQREDYCMTTTELINFFEQSRFKLRVDIPEVDWNKSSLPIDPYLLGALIGDGSLSNNFAFSNSEEDVVEKVDSILRRDWNKMLRKVPGDNVDYDIVDVNYAATKYTFNYEGKDYKTSELQELLVTRGYPVIDSNSLIKLSKGDGPTLAKRYPELVGKITVTIDDNYRSWTEGDPLRNVLRQFNLMCKSVEKHIPAEYLLTCRDDRIALLQGLFDTDGYTDTGGCCFFDTCSPQLSSDFAFLVRSLGIRDTITSYPSNYTCHGKRIYTGSTSYDHSLKIPEDIQFCTSEKHLARKKTHQHGPMRNIVSIEYLRDDECQCIMIDHDDHTYISGDGFIPTHNTTTARIIANVLNHGQGEPIEIDGASHGNVESIREIISQARTYPIGCDWKIFIIDECHAISLAAWQSLLLTLESQPAKSIFMLCTTNPEKIPATIISRVQTFQLSKISLEGIFNRLKYIIEQENKEGRNITYTDDALLYIAKLAQGGMRDAITLTDKTLAYSTNITMEVLQEALGLPNYNKYFDMLNAIAKKDNKVIIEIINEVYNSGINFVKWFEGFFGFVTNIVKYIYLQDINQTTIPSTYQDKIKGYGPAHSAICLRLSGLLTKMNQELKSTQYLQEVAISYLCNTK